MASFVRVMDPADSSILGYASYTSFFSLYWKVVVVVIAAQVCVLQGPD